MRRARPCAECGSTPRFWFTLRMASEILIHPGIGYGVAPSMRLLADRTFSSGRWPQAIAEGGGGPPARELVSPLAPACQGRAAL